jgi:deoxyribodipyrimidine photo-lyase
MGVVRTLLWYRGKDLRVGDHGPLVEAARDGDVLPVFVLDPWFFAPERARECPHRIQVLLESVAALGSRLRALGSRLLLASGRSVDVIPELAARLRVDRVAAHGWTEPFGRERDRRIAAALRVPFELYPGFTLAPPGELRTGGGRPYTVFTPFARAFRVKVVVPKPLPAPRRLPPVPRSLRTGPSRLPTLASLGIERNPRLPRGGEAAARVRVRTFLRGPARSYATDRNRLDASATSRLSADLKFGTLSVRTVWHAALARLGARSDAWRSFSSELLWREFAHAILWDFPDVLSRPFRREFEGFPWQFDERLWRAWQEGRTGFPVVDAAARQLLSEGHVPNRARMIAASFLAKDLLLPPSLGEAHYLAWLADGDWAPNNLGWQGSAGTGCDGQPWFRVFHPTTQGLRFDPRGEYVKRWLPELRRLSPDHVHEPWTAPPEVLAAAGVRLGVDYPLPVVDHAASRARYLAAVREHLRAGPAVLASGMSRERSARVSRE